MYLDCLIIGHNPKIYVTTKYLDHGKAPTGMTNIGPANPDSGYQKVNKLKFVRYPYRENVYCVGLVEDVLPCFIEKTIDSTGMRPIPAELL